MKAQRSLKSEEAPGSNANIGQSSAERTSEIEPERGRTFP